MRKRHATKLHLLSVRQVQILGEGDHSDGGGLILRVRGDGAAQWVLRFTSVTGKRREMGLGAVHRGSAAQAGQSLTAARDASQEARSQLQQGVDPIDERDRQKTAAREAVNQAKAQQQRQQLTLAKAARDYHERVIEPRLSTKHAAQWISSLENHIPAELWGRQIDTITAPDLLAAMRAVQPHERARNVKGDTLPETLRRIRQRLDTIFEDAMFHGRCSSNPAAAIKRKMREQLPTREAGAFKALDYREAPALMARIRTAEGVSARCLEFALLTAARTNEALSAAWSEFDLEARTWIIPAEKMKAGEQHVVHLSERARELVAGQIGLDEQLVFPSTMKRGRPMSNMALLATLDRLGVREQTTAHGLCRATFSTWANETAAARPDVIEACLAHKEADRVKAAYNRAQFTQERAALMQAWAQFLATRSNVVPLRAA